MRVAEVFGPTAQGEGPHIGHVCAFIRLSGCNLSCSWCDTPYTWDWTRYSEADEASDLDVAELVERVRAMSVERVVLTGGEPLMQQRRLPILLDSLALPVDVETNGTISPADPVADRVDLFAVSPKVMPSARQRLTLAQQRPIGQFRELAQQGRAVWKFVARDRDDLDSIRAFVEAFDLAPVYVMPEGRTATSLQISTRRIADEVVRLGYRLTTRLHVLAWGDMRGR